MLFKSGYFHLHFLCRQIRFFPGIGPPVGSRQHSTAPAGARDNTDGVAELLTTQNCSHELRLWLLSAVVRTGRRGGSDHPTATDSDRRPGEPLAGWPGRGRRGGASEWQAGKPGWKVQLGKPLTARWSDLSGGIVRMIGMIQ